MTIPRHLRVLLRLSLGLAVLHVIFGGIVRISGSGMGCGDNWPRCAGYWFPPLSEPTLVIEWTHRLLALLLVLSVLATAVAAWRARGEAGVGGKDGIVGGAVAALGLVVAAALFGAVTVRYANAPWATVVHWAIAASLLAVLAATLVRAGAFGADRWSAGTAKLARAAVAAAGIAFVVLILGGVTAKLPEPGACAAFPFCHGGETAPITERFVLVQMFHRVLALMLVLHLIGLAVTTRKLEGARAAVRAVRLAVLLGLVQVAVAAAMVMGGFPSDARSLHQATGVLLWVTIVVMTMLARRAAPAEAPVPPSVAVLIARGGGA